MTLTGKDLVIMDIGQFSIVIVFMGVIDTIRVMLLIKMRYYLIECHRIYEMKIFVPKCIVIGDQARTWKEKFSKNIK